MGAGGPSGWVPDPCTMLLWNSTALPAASGTSRNPETSTSLRSVIAAAPSRAMLPHSPTGQRWLPGITWMQPFSLSLADRAMLTVTSVGGSNGQ